MVLYNLKLSRAQPTPPRTRRHLGGKHPGRRPRIRGHSGRTFGSCVSSSTPPSRVLSCLSHETGPPGQGHTCHPIAYPERYWLTGRARSTFGARNAGPRGSEPSLPVTGQLPAKMAVEHAGGGGGENTHPANSKQQGKGLIHQMAYMHVCAYTHVYEFLCLFPFE